MIDLGLFKRPAFLGGVIAMVGYGSTAQVMIFYLPLFLQNAYHFSPAKAGLAMLPFALPMVLAPQLSRKMVRTVSPYKILTIGLVIVVVGNVAFWYVAHSGLPYGMFVLSMFVAGTGAGILNGETVKVISEVVPLERAGMASGISSTTRFIGVLIGLAGLGAILTGVARSHFLSAAKTAGLETSMAQAATKQVASGNLMGALDGIPETLQQSLHIAATSAFAQGFAVAGILAAALAFLACVSSYVLFSIKSQIAVQSNILDSVSGEISSNTPRDA
jgi:Na+/melibiose symporter-like transporter